MKRYLFCTYAKASGAEIAVSIRKGILIASAITILTGFSAFPQNQELQEKLAIARESARENKMRLMQYQWTETSQITLKGDPKP